MIGVILGSINSKLDPDFEPFFDPSELRQFRQSHGLTQGNFAKIIHVDQACVSFWERGKIKPMGPAAILMEILFRMDREIKLDGTIAPYVTQEAPWLIS